MKQRLDLNELSKEDIEEYIKQKAVEYVEKESRGQQSFCGNPMFKQWNIEEAFKAGTNMMLSKMKDNKY